MLLKKQLFNLFAILLSFSFSQNSFAQHDHHYDSTYSPIEGLFGNAQYDYTYDLDHLEIKSGPFTFVSNQNDTSWTSVNEEHFWEGQYEANSKSGTWLYETVRHDVDILSIEDNHLEYNLRTIKSKLTAQYKKGTPDGMWVYTSTLILKDGEPTFYEKITVPFSKGFADGKITYEFVNENGSKVLVNGTCKKGLFVGEWSFVYPENKKYITETRNYNNGVLLSLNKRNEEQVIYNLNYPLSEQTNNVVFENKGKNHLTNTPYSLDFNDGYPSSSAWISSQTTGNNLLKNAQNRLLRFDPSWAKKNRLIFGANRGKYPLTDEEEKQITDWYKLEQAFQLQVEDIKEREIRNFGTSQDSIALLTLSWVEKQEEIYKKITSLSQFFLSKEIEYLYRSELILANTKKLLSTDSLIVNNQTRVISYPVKPEAEKEIFAFMVANFEARIKVGNELSVELSKAKNSTTLEEELEILPKRIKKEKDELDSLILRRYTDKAINAFIYNVEQNFLRNQIDVQYDRFKAAKNKKTKKTIGDSILVNLNTIEHIYTKTNLIAERSEYLDSLYTEYVFDSFTFSDNVPSRYKKRLYDQVVKLNNELLDSASESNVPNTCLNYLNEIYDIQGILIYLHDKKTKTLENDLRKAKSLEERLKLLHEIL